MRRGTARRPEGSRTDPTDGLLTTLIAPATASAAPSGAPATGRPPDRVRHRRRTGARALGPVLGAAAAVAAVAALAGCANPEYRFVSNKQHDVVVRVPWNWTRIDPEDVEKLGQTAEEQQQEQEQDTQEEPGTWLAYFDSAAKPAPKHIIGENLPSPVVVLRSGDVPSTARDTLTADMLRDLVFPVSESSRAQQEAQAQATGQKLPTFKLVSDDAVKTKTSDGVHLVFSVNDEVFDQVAVTDPKRTRFHLLLVHCSKQCYDRSKGQIGEITDSFTIKKP